MRVRPQLRAQAEEDFKSPQILEYTTSSRLSPRSVLPGLRRGNATRSAELLFAVACHMQLTLPLESPEGARNRCLV
jgi:hypothetical protein